MPVMATSNSVLDKDDFTKGWYAAAGDKPPVTAQFSLGYGGNVDSDIRLAPVTLKEDGDNVLDFSGMQVLMSGDRDGKAVGIHADAGHLELNFVDEQQAPVKIQLNGFKAGGKLTETGHDMIYVGNFDLALADVRRPSGRSRSCWCSKGCNRTTCTTPRARPRTSWPGAWNTRSVTSAMPVARWAARKWS